MALHLVRVLPLACAVLALASACGASSAPADEAPEPIARTTASLTWGARTSLTPKASRSDDGFGAAVAVSADHVLVAAPGARTVTSFARVGLGYVQDGVFAQPARSGRDFGRGLAVAGDLAVVGSQDEVTPFPNGGSEGEGGRAYVLARTTGAWSLVAELSPDAPIDARLRWFGRAVATDGSQTRRSTRASDGSVVPSRRTVRR
jgi:hypothetical protein